MGRMLYIDPWAGAAGDMLLAALLDLAPSSTTVPPRDPSAVLADAVECLGLPRATVGVAPATERGFACLRVEVDGTVDSRVRTLADLKALLEEGTLPARVIERSLVALQRLAAVEGQLHGASADQVQFHEVGAVDTLVFVVGTFALIDALSIDRVVHGPVPVGSGRVSTAQGDLGVPAPAALALLRGRPVFGGPERVEVTTPTGALLLTELADEWGPLPPMEVEGSGYGAGGRRTRSGPNLLRVVLGRPLAGSGAEAADNRGASGSTDLDTVVELRTCIDDATPEVLAHAHGVLMRGGALDAWWTPVYMKKGRPGSELTVLCRPDDELSLVGLLLRETTTFGVRRSETSRHCVDREWVRVDVRDTTVRVKVGRWAGRIVNVSAEYDDAAVAADRLEIPLKDVMREAVAAAERLLRGPSQL